MVFFLSNSCFEVGGGTTSGADLIGGRKMIVCSVVLIKDSLCDSFDSVLQKIDVRNCFGGVL